MTQTETATATERAGVFHSRSLLDLGPPDLREHLSRDDSILIPLGSCEMHGNHLPLGTDIYNAIEVERDGTPAQDGHRQGFRRWSYPDPVFAV